ncbi:helix-turn-helix domain-containing protein [Rhizobium oryzicola]|uniref:helix-turn-helix domain-containing protein n=1 Tax=Rhizobium oryzicola TaxID=1232668 RepID=UPI00345C2C51
MKAKDEMGALRREAGAWLREKRETAGLSQRELAGRVGIEYYTFISQIEAGRGRVPAERYEAYANAVGVPPRDFVKIMMRYNDPITYAILFGDGEADDGKEPGKDQLSALEQRLALLESKLK